MNMVYKKVVVEIFDVPIITFSNTFSYRETERGETDDSRKGNNVIHFALLNLWEIPRIAKSVFS